jgi:hypothetical protein
MQPELVALQWAGHVLLSSTLQTQSIQVWPAAVAIFGMLPAKLEAALPVHAATPSPDTDTLALK